MATVGIVHYGGGVAAGGSGWRGGFYSAWVESGPVTGKVSQGGRGDVLWGEACSP